MDDRKAATYRISRDVLERLDGYCRATGTVRSFIAEQAIKAYLDEAEKAMPGLAGRGEARPWA